MSLFSAIFFRQFMLFWLFLWVDKSKVKPF